MKRWYDQDPLLAEVLETLKAYQPEFKAQSQIFLDKLSAEVGEEALNRFHQKVLSKQVNKFGNRWYDQDPQMSKAVELLRLLPPETQRQVAQSFLESLKTQ